MGNHQAGWAMAQTALALNDQSGKTGMTPLEILDIVCNPYQGCDAEFDDDVQHDQPFGQLLARAFLNGREYKREKDPDGEWWQANVLERFREKYGFC